MENIIVSAICKWSFIYYVHKIFRKTNISSLGKSVDWFLYDNGLRHERVKHLPQHQFQ